MKLTILILTAALAAGCVTQVRVPDRQSGVIAATDGGVIGYQHGADRSNFAVGAHAHRTLEHGYLKHVGSEGTFAIDRVNGSAYGVPKASAHSQHLGPYGKSPNDHNAFVRAYFVKSGIPVEQIGAVKGRTLLEATGTADEKERATPKVTGYYTVLERTVDGIPVADSFAWARVNAEGQIVEEAVYWPAIAGAVIAKARQLREVRDDPKRRHELATRISADASSAQIVIRHSSASSDEPFEGFASVDLLVKVMAPGTEQSPNYDKTTLMPQTAYVRHFDIDGKELFLPQERLRLPRQ